MSSLNTNSYEKYENCISRVVWAAHIVKYLTGERNQSKLLPELDEEEDFDRDKFDAETENEVVLTSSSDSVRFKFLDCVAELASPSKGWDHVVATGMRESADSIEIDIARNDGFRMVGGLQSGASHLKDADKQYFDQLQKYLASASEEKFSDLCLSWFESLAIEYSFQRVDHWTAIARQCIILLPSLQNHKADHSPKFQQAAKIWTDLIDLLRFKKIGKTIPIEQIVHGAYNCINSIEVRQIVHTTYSSQMGSKLWRILRFIARPISNCRLLIRIASRLPRFRKIKICPLSPGPKVKLSRKYLIDITDAWGRLDPASQLGGKLKMLNPFKARFKQDCARAFSSHAEVQLYSYYADNASRAPNIDYFGCSKKSCLLCEGFLQALSPPISTRERHGVCYPSWAVPYTKSEDIIHALEQLEQSLIRRIKIHMEDQPASTFLNQVPQSTIASDFPSSVLEEITQKTSMMNIVAESRQTLQRQRSILDGRLPKSGQPNSSGTAIQPQDSCVMCNSSPAKLCSRCRSCYYCSRDCQEADWACHQILCRKMSLLPPQPSPSHKLAILFPEMKAKPLLTWVPCYRKASSEYEEYGVIVEYETANVRPLLGMDDPFPGRLYIEYNPKRDRRLGSGLAAWSPRKEGYAIELIIREAFLKDGSKINRSVMESVKTSGTVHHKWCGPIVAMRQTPGEFYEDITLADFRHIMDYFVTYNTSEVREMSNPQSYTRTPGAILGVKICCYGEIKLHGTEPYVQVEVPQVHPIRHTEGHTSPISTLLLGKPLRIWKFPDIETWFDLPGWAYDLGADSNPDAGFLMMGADPGRSDWGWAPLLWDNGIGNVLVVYHDDDHRDLLVDELRLVCHFVRKKLQPMFEDSMGFGSVVRTRQEVLDFITYENMKKCEGELERDESAFSGRYGD